VVGGIPLLGAVTATLASWLVDRVAEETTSNEMLREEIALLREEIRELAAGRGGRSEDSLPPVPE
jgi:voltage-gated potassium channel